MEDQAACCMFYLCHTPPCHPKPFLPCQFSHKSTFYGLGLSREHFLRARYLSLPPSLLALSQQLWRKSWSIIKEGSPHSCCPVMDSHIRSSPAQWKEPEVGDAVQLLASLDCLSHICKVTMGTDTCRGLDERMKLLSQQETVFDREHCER